ncbi:unnamed protein product [Rhizoctonia solani]|nr:unnamed protein product [Rhizoctonia solani]
MEGMDISTSFDTANRSAITDFEQEENHVISDTNAGIITTRHLAELEHLRMIHHEAKRLAHIAFDAYREYEGSRHTMQVTFYLLLYVFELINTYSLSARPIQKFHYIGTDRVPTLPSWTEMNRLRQLYGEQPLPKNDYFLNSEMRHEYRDKRDGEVEQAAALIEELKSLRSFIRRDGILWPLMLEAEFVSESPKQSLPPVSARSSLSMGGTDQARPPPTMKSKPIATYVHDSSQDSDSLDSDVEVQDALATSSPRPAKTS